MPKTKHPLLPPSQLLAGLQTAAMRLQTTPYQIARATGMPLTTVQRLLIQQSNLPLHNVERLLAALGMTVHLVPNGRPLAPPSPGRGHRSKRLSLRRRATQLPGNDGRRRRQVTRPLLWSAARVRQLGAVTDAALSQRWRISISAIARHRRGLGIPAFGRQSTALPPIPTDVKRRLGTVADAQLARESGCRAEVLALHRARLGIRAWMPLHPIRWTTPMIDDLTTLSGVAFAQRYHVSTATVSEKRAALGLPTRRPNYAPVHWTAAMLAALGRMSDSAVARRFGIGKATVRRKRCELGKAGQRPAYAPVRWTATMVAALGRISDTQLARRFAIGAMTVTRKRRTLGIPRAPHPATR